jgi:hypothetical protein
VSPVVDRLVTDAKLLSDDLRLDLATKLQQTCRSRARIPVLVIDRKLLQCDFFGFAQFYNTLHPLPRHPKRARLAESKLIYQDHLGDWHLRRAFAGNMDASKGVGFGYANI